MVLLSILYSYILSLIKKQKKSRCEVIILTGFRNNEMPDANSNFFSCLNNAMKLYHKEFSFSVKFIENLTPNDIFENLVNILKSERKSKKFYDCTSSCYSPIDGKPCKQCPKCLMFEELLKKFFHLEDQNLI